MVNTAVTTPTYDLWTENWISLEDESGRITRYGLGQTLQHAHEYRALFDHSPLAVVGIQRLLTAIIQFIYSPTRQSDIKKLLSDGHFSASKLDNFHAEYADRFDLFSKDHPFYQSADLPLIPAKGDAIKTVAYLMPEVPSGTEVTHFRHGDDADKVLCPRCAATGLAVIPAFATSGGAGIKPSVNGVPPIYVVPAGKTLFECLVLSLVTPDFQPKSASTTRDDVWWVHKPNVQKSKEIREVGYLHSLTFPARRVRLHPENIDLACTRCNEKAEWMVRTMVFEMGESRPKTSAPWLDPFAAYRIVEGKPPTPIRPQEGKATWREFSSLFLATPVVATSGRKKAPTMLRPTLLNQMAAYDLGTDVRTFPFRCVGLRTDMKAKIFEWLDAGFDVPPTLLSDQARGIVVRDAISFTADCAYVISSVFRSHFGGTGKKGERYAAVKVRMLDSYWSALGSPFRLFVIAMGATTDTNAVQAAWSESVIKIARRVFTQYLELVGDEAAILRKRVEAESHCSRLLAKLRRDQAGGNTK